MHKNWVRPRVKSCKWWKNISISFGFSLSFSINWNIQRNERQINKSKSFYPRFQRKCAMRGVVVAKTQRKSPSPSPSRAQRGRLSRKSTRQFAAAGLGRGKMSSKSLWPQFQPFMEFRKWQSSQTQTTITNFVHALGASFHCMQIWRKMLEFVKFSKIIYSRFI